MRSPLAINFPKRLDRIELWIFLASGALVLLVSSPLIQTIQFSLSVIVFIYILPWAMLWPVYCFEVIKSSAYRVEIIISGTIIILGILNIILTDSIYNSFNAMRFFLLSGIIPFWTSFFIFNRQYQRDYFYYFSCCFLFLIASAEIIAYLLKSDGLVFTYNPIPLGTLVILLAAGPLNFLSSESFVKKVVGLVAGSLGLILIIITQKRGTFLAVSAMAMAWIFHQYRRSVYTILVMLAVIAFLIPFGWTKYKSLDNNILSDRSILHRLELYPFAFHVFKKHPVWGTGLRPFTHDLYLHDYPQKNRELTYFASYVTKQQTFDNMFITAFVELGTLMTLAYLGLISYVIVNYWQNMRSFSPNHKAPFIPLLPLIGLAIHSLTYDSLIFPQINWLFHVQLGILAGYGKAKY